MLNWAILHMKFKLRLIAINSENFTIKKNMAKQP